jgi:hypothetical protein
MVQSTNRRQYRQKIFLQGDYYWDCCDVSDWKFLLGYLSCVCFIRLSADQVLKGLFKNSVGGIALRKGFILDQFVTSVILIDGTIIVF